MPQSKNQREPEMPPAQKSSDHQCTGLISVEGIEPGLQSLGTENVSLNEDSARRDDSFDSEKKFGLQGYFVSKEWHGPYVKALLETDSAKLGSLIVEAERAIVGRFLELLVSSVETDEFLDLQSAGYAITQLKKANVLVFAPQHLVA
jgi:hypothetical protein